MIKVFLGGLYPNTPFYTNANDSFSELISRSGFTVVGEPKEASAFISLDIHEKDLDHLSKSDDTSVSILLRNEPRIVWPLNYESSKFTKFDVIFDLGRFDNHVDSSFLWPQFWPINFPEIDETRLEKIAMISGNKLSLISGELYSLRRRCIFGIEKLDHFGTSWDSRYEERLLEFLRAIRLCLKSRIVPNFRSTRYWFKKYTKWLGSPVEKRQCLAEYKYSLVIENSADYLSEKLFDAFFSLTIPIYVGPDIQKYGIPADLVVQCEPNLGAVKSGVQRAFEINYVEWCNNLKAWLNSPQTKSEWEGYAVYGNIIDEIRKIVENSK